MKFLGPASVIWDQIFEIWPQQGQTDNPALKHTDQSKASRQFAQPSLLRLGEKKAKTKTTI